MRHRSIALAGLLLAVSRQATVVPSAFLLEATRDPIVMLMLLAHAKVPAGLEVHVSDQAPRTMPDFQFAREPGVPVEAS